MYPISLEEYILKAIDNSEAILDYQDSVTNSKYDLEASEMEFDTSVTPRSSINTSNVSDTIQLGVSISKPNTYGGEIYSDILSSKDNYSNAPDSYGSVLKVGYKQSIFRKWGERYNSYNLLNSKENYKLLEDKKNDIISNIIIEATKKYYNVVLAHYRSKIYLESFEKAERTFNISKEKNKVGLVSNLDVYRAKLNMLNSKRNYRDSQKNYQNNIYDLYYFINGNDINIELKNSQINFKTKKFNKNFEVSNDYNILSKNIELKELLIKKKLKLNDVFIKRRNILPDVTVTSEYTRSGNEESFDSSWKEYEEDWSINLSTQYDFTNNQNSIQYQKSLIEQKQNIRKIRRKIDELNRDIKNMLNEYESLKTKIEISLLEIEQAELSYEAAKIKYDQGIGTNENLFEASQKIQTSKISYMTNLLEYNLSILQLAYTQSLLNYNFFLGLLNE